MAAHGVAYCEIFCQMIQEEKLREVFDTELKPRLQSLEGLRKKVLGNIFLIVGVFLLFLFFITSGFIASSAGAGWVSIIGLIVGLVYFIIRAGKKYREYRKRYKEEVVSEVVRLIDPSWVYEPYDCISEMEYWQSDLFRLPYDRYSGDDLISGVIDRTDFRCSELHTEYKEVTYRDGKRHETWITIFRGLFFHADFNKHINGRTYIEPDNAERLFGKWGRKFQVSSKGKLVKLEDPEFEKMFVVFSTDQVEARYILTPALMQALVELRNRINRNMYLSFIGSRVYVAVQFGKGLFEPRIASSCVKYEDVQQMHALFLMNSALVKELNLNTRIWTKE